MRRQPDIRWRESDAEKLTKEVERFNAKIYRTRHRHPELADILPDTIKKADKLQLTEQFKEMPRAEFNKYLNSLDRFTERGAEKVITNKEGVSTTAWKKREIEIETATANREKAKERQVLDVDLNNIPRDLMNDIKVNELKPKNFDFNKIKSKKELEMFERVVKKQGRVNRLQQKMEEYKKNYLYTIDYELSGAIKNNLYNFIKNVPAEILYGKYFEDDPVLKIKFIYDPQSAETIVYESLSHWKSVLGDTDFMKYYDGEDLEELELLTEDYDDELVKEYLKERG